MAYLTFHFPWNVSASDAINQVATHFGVSVSIGGAPANVPAHIKTAVEAIAADLGVEQSPSVAFGALLNGAAGNVQATPANVPSSAGVATLPTAPVASLDISATSLPVSSAPVPPTVNAAGAPVESAATANPASNGVEFDSTGLAWDERIHSGNKTKTPAGEWRSKKGADKNIIKQVELELRAKYPNGATPAGAVQSAAANAPASPTNAPVLPDRAAGIAYAHAEGLRVAGPQLLDDATIDQLNNGKSYTLSPEQNEWYSIYFAKRNAAFAEFMSRAPNVASGTPAAPVSPAATGSVPAAPAAPVSPVASLTAAVGTVPPAPNAPLDASGLPHDPRIHVGAKIKDTSGVWVQRHDVPGETKLLIMAELRAAMGNVAAAPSTDPNGAVGAAPVALTPPGVTAEQAGSDFTKLMQWIVANQVAKRITTTAGPDAARDLGFADANGNGQLVLMREHPAYFPHVVAMLQGQGAI
jgi:hypothetical protein